MADFAEQVRKARANRRLPLPTEGELDEPILSRLFSPVSALFEGIGYVDAATRAGIANIIGTPQDARTGQETFLGTAPSGRELLGLGEGERGTFESGDIPGFAVEALASPLNLIGLGAVTKGGKAAAQLGKVEARLNALQKTGQAAERASEIADLTSRAAKLRTGLAGKATEYGKTLAEQVRNKQRSLLSLDVPFTDINVPLSPFGGRVSESVLGGIGRGAGALGGLGRAAARTIGITDPGAFTRLEGRASPERFIDTTRFANQPERMAIHDDIMGVAEERARTGLGEGVDQKAVINQALKRMDPVNADAVLGRIVSKNAPLVAEATTKNRTIVGLEKKLAKAKAAGDDYAASRIEKRLTLLRQRANANAGLEGGDARQQLLNIATLRKDQSQFLGDKSGRMIAMAKERIDKWKVAERVAMVTNDQQLAQTARSQMTRIKNTVAGKVAENTRMAKMSKNAVQEIVRGAPEIMQEANRITMVADGKLASEMAEGLQVAPLDDPFGLGYMRRLITPEGRKVAQQLAKADPSSTFAPFARLNAVEQGFMKERIPAFDGMTEMQINDLFRSEAAKNKIPFTGQFFAEDAGEQMLRRMTESGKAFQNASYHRGVINQFMIPRKMARDGDTPIAEYLEKIGVTKFEGTDLTGGVEDALKGTQYEGMFVPKDMAKQALETAQVANTPEVVKAITDAVGWWTGMMRGAVTIMFPAFHARNATSNAFMLWLAGMKTTEMPGRLIEAFKVQRGATRALMNPKAATAEDKAAFKLYEKIRSLGAADATLADESAELMGGSALAKTEKGLGWAAGKGRAVGRGIENNAKIALFLDGVKNGLSESEAAERVKKYLFNYADLSRFEKDYLRRWAFFYTWQRKAIPLMFESVLTDTRKIRLAALAGGQTQEGEQRDMLSPYQASQHSIPFGSDDSGKRKFLQLGLPMDQLFQYEPDQKTGFAAVRTGARKVLSNLSPLPAMLSNLATGTSLRTGRPVGVVDAVTDATPVARFLTFGQAITDPPEDQTGGDAAARLILGLSQTRSDPQTAPFKRLLDKLDNKKAEIEQSHLNSLIPGNREARNEQLRVLRSLESRVRSRLAKIQGGN